MKEIIKIFNDRIIKEQNKKAIYNKYIFNSHLIMFLLIVFGAVAFNYSNWVSNATDFQLKLVLFIILFVMIYFLATIKVKTFIKNADSVFLLPLENEYEKIIKKIYVPTIIFKIFLMLFFIFISYPIVSKLEISYKGSLIFFITLLFLFFNIIFLTIITYKKVVYDVLLPKDLGFIFVLYLLVIIPYIFNLLTPLGLLFIPYYILENKKIVNNINWYGAAEYDNIRMEKYLKFINMFVDVPIDVVKVHRRKYLDIFLTKISKSNFNKDNAYMYYYSRAFLRQENTLFLILRLFIFAIVFIYSLNNIYASLIIFIAFNYLTIIQLIPIYKRFNSIIWFSIIPINNKLKASIFKKLVFNFMLIFNILLLLFLLIFDFNIILLAPFIISLFLNGYFLRNIK